MANTVSKLLAVALAEEGYLEKASNSQLDDKTANAGKNNYTKYARDLDALKDFYNGRKNGFDWCDVFVDWCFVQAFGREAAQKMLGQPNKSLGAGCRYSANYFDAMDDFHKTNPKPGDQIFFYSSDRSYIAHTGLVYAVDNNKVYTIEGNTSGASGVVANGGGVAKKSYLLTNGRIYGYGRPEFDPEEEATSSSSSKPMITTLRKGDKGPEVINLQKRLIELGYSCGTSGADGDFGLNTENAVKAFQADRNLTVDGIVGTATQTELKKDNPAPVVESSIINAGDVIKIKKGAKYTNGVIIPQWIIDSTCYARQKEDAKGRVVFSIQRTGAITGTVSKEYIEDVITNNGYEVTVTAKLNMRQGPGTSYKVIKILPKGSKQIVTEEKDGWGKLVAGGWVSLNYVKKI